MIEEGHEAVGMEASATSLSHTQKKLREVQGSAGFQ